MGINMQQSALAEIAKVQKNEAFSEAETVTERTLMPDLGNVPDLAIDL